MPVFFSSLMTLFAMAAPLLGCSNGDSSPTSAGDVPLGREFQLKPGESVTLPDEQLRVGFETVTTDSRCPVDVQCVWEGDAIARVPVERIGGDRTTVELHTSVEPREAAFAGYTVRLTALAPQPREGRPIEKKDYVVTLVVTRK